MRTAPPFWWPVSPWSIANVEVLIFIYFKHNLSQNDFVNLYPSVIEREDALFYVTLNWCLT